MLLDKETKPTHIFFLYIVDAVSLYIYLNGVLYAGRGKLRKFQIGRNW